MTYTKKASTIDEQISLLKARGMKIEDEAKAREILLDIGYYRLGFYWYCYENTEEPQGQRNHLFKEGASFSDVVRLYYFDCDLRKIILPYLNRIEVNFRTKLIYHASNRYKQDAFWFVNPQYVHSDFIRSFGARYQGLKKNLALKRHHKKYGEEGYAPAWKTLEYMPFGDVLRLYQSLKEDDLKVEIAGLYQIRNVDVFENYINTIRVLRNLCAHGRNIFDLNLQKSLARGPISLLTERRKHNLTGCLLVTCYILNVISSNRVSEIKEALHRLLQSPELNSIREIIKDIEVCL